MDDQELRDHIDWASHRPDKDTPQDVIYRGAAMQVRLGRWFEAPRVPHGNDGVTWPTYGNVLALLDRAERAEKIVRDELIDGCRWCHGDNRDREVDPDAGPPPHPLMGQYMRKTDRPCSHCAPFRVALAEAAR